MARREIAERETKREAALAEEAKGAVRVPRHDWQTFPGGAPVDATYHWCRLCGSFWVEPSGDPSEFWVLGEVAPRTLAPECVEASVFATLAAYIDENHVGRDDDPHDVAKDIRNEILAMGSQAGLAGPTKV